MIKFSSTKQRTLSLLGWGGWLGQNRFSATTKKQIYAKHGIIGLHKQALKKMPNNALSVGDMGKSNPH